MSALRGLMSRTLVRAGIVTYVFSSLTLHRAGPNPTGAWRRSWVIQFTRPPP